MSTCSLAGRNWWSKLLEQDPRGILGVRQSHAYYYQIQVQMFMYTSDMPCNATLVWSDLDDIVLSTNPCDMFIKSDIERAVEYFKYCILPKVFCKRYSRAPNYRCRTFHPREPLVGIPFLRWWVAITSFTEDKAPNGWKKLVTRQNVKVTSSSKSATIYLKTSSSSLSLGFAISAGHESFDTGPITPNTQLESE